MPLKTSYGERLSRLDMAIVTVTGIMGLSTDEFLEVLGMASTKLYSSLGPIKGGGGGPSGRCENNKDI